MVLHRIKEYIDFKNISIARFESEIGMSNNSFRKSLNTNGSIGSDKLEKILNKYPDISAEWLLTGNGKMLKSESEPVVASGKYVELLEKYAALQEAFAKLLQKQAAPVG